MKSQTLGKLTTLKINVILIYLCALIHLCNKSIFDVDSGWAANDYCI